MLMIREAVCMTSVRKIRQTSFDAFNSINALPVPMLRQIFILGSFGGPILERVFRVCFGGSLDILCGPLGSSLGSLGSSVL